MLMLAHLAGRCEGEQTQLADKRSIAGRAGRNAGELKVGDATEIVL
jgi:hypothetical protein